MQIVHFADAHIGTELHGRLDPETLLNTRLLDFTRRLDEIVDFAIENEVDLVLFAGDAFKSRDPSPTHQREFARRIRRLSEAGIPLFLLVGNHDVAAASGRATSVDIYATLGVEGVTVGDIPKIYIVSTRAAGPLQIVALPWLRPSAIQAWPAYRDRSLQEIREGLEQIASAYIDEACQQLDPALPAIFCGHLTVDGAVLGNERSAILGDDVSLTRSTIARPQFAYVALGHIHKHQVLQSSPPVVYAGSIDRVDFGEEDDAKGFVDLRLEGGRATWQFRALPARQFVTIRAAPNPLDPTGSILDEIRRHPIEGSIVRLYYDTDPDLDPQIDRAAIRAALTPAFSIAGIIPQVRRPDRRGGNPQFERLTPIDALDHYLAQRDVAADRRVRLRALAAELDAEIDRP